MKVPTRWTCLIVATLAPTLGACGDEDPLGPEDVEYATELGIDIDRMTRLPTGVYIETLMPGFGSRTLMLSDSVDMSYTLWLPNGVELQSGEFSVFLTSLIPGFQDGVDGMTKGEIRLILIPPARGYGDNPPAGIPPNAVLVFRVELLEIQTIE
ncbi:MAG TPA: FKBP-type peptidyl-prolyl cis-trans isomerase [Longimicrobiales bacterium]|jgi:FKBP-type peptidyl-prolyl cis-trans isomerase